MKNGHSKLVAKIQYFYDLITTNKERNEDDAMSTDDNKERQHKRCVAECYANMSAMYSETFKEFLYNSHDPSDA